MTEPRTRRPTPDSTLVLPAGADRAVWLQARRWRDEVDGGWCIGASDAPSILDLPGVGTPREVYQAKIHNIERPETEAMRWGRKLEPVVADEWTHRRQSVVRSVGLVSNVDNPWLQCTLDRRVAECPDNPDLKSRCGLEVKTRGAFNNKRWHAEVPDELLCQCHVQMLVTGYRHMHTAILVGGNDLKDPVVWWDEDVARYILEQLTLFRDGSLIPRIEPEWSEEKADKEIELDRQLHPERIGDVGVDDMDGIVNYVRDALKESKGKAARKQALARLLRIANGKRTLLFNGEQVAWWTEGTRTNVDLDVLARFPDAYRAAVSTKKTWTVNIAKAIRELAQ
jgi:putative phage-type endonuclease